MSDALLLIAWFVVWVGAFVWAAWPGVASYRAMPAEIQRLKDRIAELERSDAMRSDAMRPHAPGIILPGHTSDERCKP